MKYIFYPLQLLGNALRSLSLISSVGNIAAIVIYCVISLIPFLCYLWLYKKKKNQKVDYILLIMSGVLFFVIYYLINPTLFMQDANVNLPEMGDYMLIGFFYSLMIGYLVLKGINYCTAPNEQNLQKGLRIILYTIMAILVVSTGSALLVELPKAIKTLEGQNIGNDIWNLELMKLAGGRVDMSASIVLVVLQQLVKVIPAILEFVILLHIIKLIRSYGEERYSEQVSSRLDHISSLCMKMLKITIGSNVLLNVFQIIMRKHLYGMSMDLSIPVVEIAIVLGLLLITRYVRESQKIKEENDMFI